MRARIRRLGPLAAVTASTAIGVGVVAAVDPEPPGHHPICPLLILTGYYCPACGSLRAVHALTRADLHLAVDRNPLLVACLPFLLAAYLCWARRLVLGHPSRTGPAPRWVSWGLPALLIGFGVLRNVPALSWLAP
ncbi:MAG TPA: DUF2752 domain-containing protein [Kineosporiaceae bacterium]|nr:DUF2752 domain-containing protein [Kineosporiaceae bacterium]